MASCTTHPNLTWIPTLQTNHRVTFSLPSALQSEHTRAPPQGMPLTFHNRPDCMGEGHRGENWVNTFSFKRDPYLRHNNQPPPSPFSARECTHTHTHIHTHTHAHILTLTQTALPNELRPRYLLCQDCFVDLSPSWTWLWDVLNMCLTKLPECEWWPIDC